jgi:hypothetical protein
MVLSEHVHVPFVDRGGLLGCAILPWKDGDEDVYDIFDITRDTPRKPRDFRDDEPSHFIVSTTTDITASTESETPTIVTDVIGTLPLVTDEPTVPIIVPDMYDYTFPDPGTTEPYLFDYSFPDPIIVQLCLISLTLD